MLDFNPRSHEGSDAELGHHVRISIISIHAPTRGATGGASGSWLCLLDFNPRSHEGSDPGTLPGWSQPPDFNPRSHEGSDRPTPASIGRARNFNPRSHEGSDSLWCPPASFADISIHAPTRGATHEAPGIYDNLIRFQSTLPRGERPRSKYSRRRTRRFQSTLPRGERRGGGSRKWAASLYFNPRSHEGSDVERQTEQIAVVISIHAPTRGATVAELPAAGQLDISIHAPTRGATRIPVKLSPQEIFQSTLPRGERPYSFASFSRPSNFNPRSHEGSDICWLL